MELIFPLGVQWFLGGLIMQTAVAISSRPSATDAGRDLVDQIRKSGINPQASIVFAAPSYEHQSLLAVLADAFPDSLMVGASSAGEFMNQTRGEGLVCVMAISDEEVSFSIAVGHDVKSQPAEAARQIVGDFKGVTSQEPGSSFCASADRRLGRPRRSARR